MKVEGVGKHRVKKSQIFFTINWQIGVVAFILLFPLFFSRGRAGELRKNASEASGSEVWVDVKLKGAERLDEIIELKKRISELEALERKAKAENARLEAERNLLKQELFDVIKQMETQNAEFRQLEQSGKCAQTGWFPLCTRFGAESGNASPEYYRLGNQNRV